MHTLAAFAMSELCSAFPVSGGLYYWSFMLGGKHGPFASWMVGWINLLGQVYWLKLEEMAHVTSAMVPRGCSGKALSRASKGCSFKLQHIRTIALVLCWLSSAAVA